ncbi:UDP-2,4-diacetamido-2,4,6-trideoxy-beta-L-altropyranose hydrolase [Pontibacter arcticus]|uniref:UDP-2,4-diacetamido-2,4, 6-trideoxy-beta-L-altropyranose hydrolase n=1 Tax=Pontibacter arcticus TaxID=2080288 RepID=A0A364RF98_9BACT|nr:UDP-2,4-diacetamido-2,4,6-trideoxy-beta-L-altropyranose hydrolase [Pontibacter arcticus]RAU82969.1 UDP-2,4-diacetamido-2,4,6-trideoxy-beta-L-altropyranose hydrolase [Pontibacter arcticus]
MAQKSRIIFRADGNSRIGLGHVVRSLALAAMLREEFECIFAIQAPDENLQQQIKAVCHGSILLPATSPEEDRFVHELSAYVSEEEIVVLDGYHFNTTYQQNLKASGCSLVCIDDIHAYPFVADVVVNMAGGLQAAKYKTAPHTKLLLGPKYALLRPPFLKAAKSESRFSSDKKQKVLLNLGGADPENHTLAIAQELSKNKSITSLEIVVGSAYRHLSELKQFIKQQPACKLHQNLDAEAMAQLMQACPVAVTSASGVAYEYAAIGGILYIKQTAENQAGLYNFLIETGLASPYRDAAIAFDPQHFEEKVKLQRAYFDGKSHERFRSVFRNLQLAQKLKLRDVTSDDLLLLLDWANDPEVRAHSFNPDPITLENHTRWLTSRLQDKAAKLYIAEIATQPAAHIRFEVTQQTATISYLIAKEFRGKGLGHTVLQKGVKKLLGQMPEVRLIEGLVQPDNIASVRAFEKAGFTYGTPDDHYPTAHRFILEMNK